MSKPSTARGASVRDCDQKELVVDESVSALGFGFLHLPPTSFAPLVIKTVKQDSWAEQQGIVPGSELLELDGQEAGGLSAEEFRQVLKQRPLRLKLAPPNGEVWKQVAAFQQQVVALSLQKVHLQQALKDESDRVMRELGICTELEKSNSMQHKAKLLKDEAQRMQEKQALEEGLENLKAELQSSHEQLAAEQQQMDAERSKWQAELEASHAQLAAEAKLAASEHSTMQEKLQELQAKVESGASQLESEQQIRLRMEEENQQLQANYAESEAQLLWCKTELEAAQKGSQEAEQKELAELTRCRMDLENERQLLAASQAELEAEKSRQASEKSELEALRKTVEERNPHLQEALSELSKLRLALTAAQPELQLLSELAPEPFKVESSAAPTAPALAPAAPAPARRSYARRSVVPVAPVVPTAAESEEEMF